MQERGREGGRGDEEDLTGAGRTTIRSVSAQSSFGQTRRKKGRHLDVVKVGGRLERVIVPVQVLAPAVQVGVVVSDRAEVALEVADVDPAWSIPG